MARLNPAQKAAVEHDQGPMLVLAGAGSGKTRVITERIARLVNSGTRPEAILGVTFTNKAAGEMVERVGGLIGTDRASKVLLSTFHSFGVRFLSEEGRKQSRSEEGKSLGSKGRFVIYDQGDSLGLLREVYRRQGDRDRKLDLMSVLTRISLWKNAFVLPGEEPDSDFEYDVVARDLYPEYEASLRAMRAVDFDDLVVVPVRMMQKDPELRDRWRNRFRYLMIDEFQDTNRSQLELIKMLTNSMNNVCVVGDDDQSIYGWRGADVGNILDFERHYPGTKVVKLVQNYRSVSQILSVANAAIAQSRTKRHDKELVSARGPGEPIRLSVMEDTGKEAKFVAREIADEIKRGRRYSDFAVLYRSNLQARLIEEELRIFDIPYRLYGGTQFFDRKEVKDAAAYLRVIVNPRDELSFRRILNYPPRGVGTTSVQRLEAHAAKIGVPFNKVVTQADTLEGISPVARSGIRSLLGILSGARAKLKSGTSLVSVTDDLLDSAGFKADMLDADAGPSGGRRWQNLKFLLKALDRFEKNEGAKPSLANFLQRITMRVEQEEEDAKNRVTLSSLHASKGLEFPVVFLIGCVEGQLPHSRTTDPKITEAAPTDVDEERRLFYVGVTRAMDRLYLTRPQFRMMRGKVSPAIPTRFLDGLPKEDMQEYERVELETSPDEIADMTLAILESLGG